MYVITNAVQYNKELIAVYELRVSLNLTTCQIYDDFVDEMSIVVPRMAY